MISTCGRLKLCIKEMVTTELPSEVFLVPVLIHICSLDTGQLCFSDELDVSM